ncbi:MAG: hypothetical protein IPJ14_14935 [Kineosporiaceae bacterium]|nr:hypothetical protein [Kineosporiaceae bacterium]MBK7623913.1 hypothetical protein [Kineosporiaceae bacterium]
MSPSARADCRVAIVETSVEGVIHRSTLSAAPNAVLAIGREAPVPLGVEPLDRRISRVAVEVTRTDDGWLVRSVNRNGVVVHPWGMPSYLARPREVLSGSRVALRILGTGDARYWVLLEHDGPDDEQASARTSVLTDVDPTVRPLTKAQRDVVTALFCDLLSWPPVVPSEPRQLKQVARQIGISVSGVQARLHEVRAKAESLGLSRRVPLADPEYLYVLVRAGYLQPDLDAVPTT